MKGMGQVATFNAVREPLMKTDWSRLEERALRSANLGAFRVKKGRGQRKNRQAKGVQHLRFGQIFWFRAVEQSANRMAQLAARFMGTLTPREREVLAKRYPHLLG